MCPTERDVRLSQLNGKKNEPAIKSGNDGRRTSIDLHKDDEL